MQPPTKRAKLMEEVSKLPESFQHPFKGNGYGNGANPKTVVEICLLELSGAIRSKPQWYEKMKDEQIVSRWREEARQQGADDKSINFVLDELVYYDSLRDGNIVISPVDGVWQADGLIPEEIKNALLKGVKTLEDVPDSQKDWHPGSDQQVLDLVHPSLFCLVSGVSLQRTESEEELRKEKLTDCLQHLGTGVQVNLAENGPSPYSRSKNYALSEKFQWLPSEIFVDQDGNATIQTYINNLHPEWQKELYAPIERIFERFVPMFNKVLTDMTSIRPNRIKVGHWYDSENNDSDLDDDAYEAYIDNRVPKLPEVPKFIAPPKPLHPVDLRGHQLQVIVKLANIILTPEKPSYPGGTWHVEGMLNERIVASGIYYYVSENISESLLQFREAICEPDYEQYDDKGVLAIYGLENEEPLNQPRGALRTQADRCIAFPNTMQHRVAPFRLEDETKPGYRKILVFFLIDPTARITSTMNIPPQRKSWFLDVLLKTDCFKMLPFELIQLILEFVAFPMDLEDAKVYREELMKERKFFVKENTESYFERPFSLCEH